MYARPPPHPEGSLARPVTPPASLTPALAAAPLAAVLLAAALAAGCPADPDPCAVSTGGAPWLAFATRRAGHYDVWISREDGTCQRPVSGDAGQDLLPTWSVAGRLAFASDRGGVQGIFVVDLATGAESPLDVGGSGLLATSPAWSPDGAWLAFEGWEPGAASTDVYLVAAAGGAPVNLTRHAAIDAAPAWAPDGRTLYFVSTRNGPYEVHALDPATCPAPPEPCPAPAVTAGSRVLGRPAVTPDGATLVFARSVAGGSDAEVVALPLAGGAARVVSGPGDSEPAVSPDGRRLLVRSLRHGNPEVLLLDLASGALLGRLTDQAAADGTPAWAPAR